MTSFDRPTPFPYQVFGAKWLSERSHALLADEQGVGKSAQAILASGLIGAKSILVVCRAVARSNWRDEFHKFGDLSLKIQVIYDGKTNVSAEDAANVVVCSYEGAEKVLKSGRKFDLAIVDESHYVKSTDAKRTKTVFGKTGLVRIAKRMWLLTGTPTPNHAGELWPALYTFRATGLKFDEFVSRFCVVRKTGFGDQIVGTKTDTESLKELRSIINKITLRRTKEEVNLDLPPINFSLQTVDAGPVRVDEFQLFFSYIFPKRRLDELNQKIEEEMGLLNGILESGVASDALMETLKASAKSLSTVRRYTALQKLEPTADLIRAELLSGAYQKVVIFAIHRDSIEGMRNRLLDFHPVTIYGGTDPTKVERNVKKFQDPKSKCRVMIANIHAAGTSLTLTAANNVVFLEQAWTPGDNAQAAMRCHRIGQERPVFVRTIILEGSIDKRVSEVLARKTMEIAQIFSKESAVAEGTEKNSLPFEKLSPTRLEDLF